MSKRPDLFTSYQKEISIFPNNTQKFWFITLLIASIYVCFVASDYWLILLTNALLVSIAAWGLNIVSGLAGQINLAHGVFVGIGTYTSAVLGGVATRSVIGFELDLIIWLPLSGIVAALIGLIISPIAVRLKGLNLGLVTLAFVFIGAHFFNNMTFVTGGSGLGRKAAKLNIFGIDFNSGYQIGDFLIQKNQILYLISLLVAVLLGLGVKNLVRSKTGRAFAAIRDRDIAAEALGINLFKFKATALAISCFYGGVAGALLTTTFGGVEPGTFNLLYSILFIAIVIIGGAGTVLGPLFGAFFYVLFPAIIQYVVLSSNLSEQDLLITPQQIERIIFGLFIILFLIFEPRGLWGIWFRLRNYFKAWPFSY